MTNISIPYQIKLNSKDLSSIDFRYGPYETVQDAIDLLGPTAHNILAKATTIAVIETNEEGDDVLVEYWNPGEPANETLGYTVNDFVKKGGSDAVEYEAGTNISIDNDNKISCTYSYTLPSASASELGGVKIGTGLSLDNDGKLTLDHVHQEISSAERQWLTSQLLKELLGEGEEFMRSSTTTDPSTIPTYITDSSSASSVTCTVTFKLFTTSTNDDGTTTTTYYKADSVPTGWTETGTNNTNYTYTKTITGSNTTAGQTTFTVTYNYKGTNITVNEVSEAKSISVLNPAYYGFYPSNDIEDIQEVVESITRTETKVSGLKNFTNSNDSASYFWVITKGSCTGTAAGNTIFNSVINNNSFNSPVENCSSIECSGYRVYISKNSAKAGGGFDNIQFSLTL